MKKWVYGALFAILAVPVYAQEIVLGRKSYPLVLAIPLGLVALLWVFVILVALYRRKDHFFQHVLKLNALFKHLHFKWKKRVEKKIEKAAPKKDLSKYLERLDALEKKLPRVKIDLALREFTTLVRDFFSDLLNLDYQFTDEELVAHVGDRKKDIAEFTHEIAEIKYSPEGVNLDQLDRLITKFRGLARPYMRGVKKEGKELNIFERIIAEDKKLFENIKHYVEFLKTESKKKEIVELLHAERTMFNDEIRSLKKAYNRILAMYVQLSPHERAELYPQLLEFYHTVNNAIFSSVYGEKSREQLKHFEHELQKIRDMPKKHSVLYQLGKAFRKKEVPVEHPKKESLKDLAVHWLKERIKTEKQKRKGVQERRREEAPHSVEFPEELELAVPKPSQLKKKHEKMVKPAHDKITQPQVDLRSLARKEKHKMEQLRAIQQQRTLPMQKTAPPPASEGQPLWDEERLLLEKMQSLHGKPQHHVNYYHKVKSGISAMKNFLRQERLKRAESTYTSIQPYLAYLDQKQQKVAHKELSKLGKELQMGKARAEVNAKVEGNKHQALRELEEQERKLISELDQVLKSL